MSDDGFCHFCKSNTETLAHLFFYCRRTNWIFLELELKINHVLEDDSKPAIIIAPYHFILGLMHGNGIFRAFVNFIFVLAKWEIWKIRNAIKFDYILDTVLEHTMQKIDLQLRF